MFGSRQRTALPAFALAALFVLAQSTAFTHFLLVRHVVCPQHGELIHADEESTTPASDGFSTAPAKSSHAHDRCVVLAAGGERLSLHTATVQLHLAVTVSKFDPNDVLTQWGLLLHLAPKQSPPA